MKDRMVLGRDADAAETAALTLADPRATERIVEELDRETDRKSEGGRIGAALRRLNADDRAFARAVLGGMGWRDMGCSERTFYWRLKKLENFFMPENKGSN